MFSKHLPWTAAIMFFGLPRPAGPFRALWSCWRVITWHILPSPKTYPGGAECFWASSPWNSWLFPNRWAEADLSLTFFFLTVFTGFCGLIYFLIFRTKMRKYNPPGGGNKLLSISCRAKLTVWYIIIKILNRGLFEGLEPPFWLQKHAFKKKRTQQKHSANEPQMSRSHITFSYHIAS